MYNIKKQKNCDEEPEVSCNEPEEELEFKYQKQKKKKRPTLVYSSLYPVVKPRDPTRAQKVSYYYLD